MEMDSRLGPSKDARNHFCKSFVHLHPTSIQVYMTPYMLSLAWDHPVVVNVNRHFVEAFVCRTVLVSIDLLHSVFHFYKLLAWIHKMCSPHHSVDY